MKKHAVLFIGSLRETGGGLLVGVWMTQALASDYRVTILSWEGEDLRLLDTIYGTELADTPDIEIVTAPNWVRSLFALIPGLSLNLLRSMIMMRICRRLAAREAPELVVSNNGETDIGRRLVQYIHYPWMAWPRPEVELQWYHWSPAVLLYRNVCAMAGGYRKKSAVENLSLVNSSWTRDVFSRFYDAPSTVLYPPVPTKRSASRPWEEREDAFACIGRFSPEKRQLEAIEIVGRLRALGYELNLHLIGLPGDAQYLEKVRAAAVAAGPWVTLHLNVPRERIFELAGSCRYGLHAMIDEHFGIAVAELLQLGCLPFVHNSGGPREIVADDRMTWNDESDAIVRIKACLDSPSECLELRRHASTRGELFSEQQFMREFLAHCRALEQTGSK